MDRNPLGFDLAGGELALLFHLGFLFFSQHGVFGTRRTEDHGKHKGYTHGMDGYDMIRCDIDICGSRRGYYGHDQWIMLISYSFPSRSLRIIDSLSLQKGRRGVGTETERGETRSGGWY
ncbi:hypothetical protein BKA61DRAFT_115086 [Leptodontidium sp. MPI-SDFR-AT-0119]|nr:hypothetical protein BKA61DRAFT_115086 [Leptodontidium sp. MPI-SDFR-AT-0119]